MKKFIYVFIASLAVVSCQNEDLVTENSSVEKAKVQLVQVTDKGEILPVGNRTRAVNADGSYVLQFDSKATYEATIKQLEYMSAKEKLAFAESYGLQSLQQLAVMADEELEQIGTEASSEADFKEKYEAYKAKYANVLITNPYDASDLSLYVPDGDKVSTYLVGKNAMLVIGNEINKVSLTQDMANSDKAVFVSEIQTIADENLNGFKIRNGSKQTNCDVALNPATLFVNVHIGLQKKMWYGWKRDSHRDIYYRIALTNFTYNYWVDGNRQVNIGCPDLYVFKGTGKIDYRTGYLSGGPRSLQGMIYVWTDMTAGTEKTTFDFVVEDNVVKRKETWPKCDRSTSYSSKIALSL